MTNPNGSTQVFGIVPGADHIGSGRGARGVDWDLMTAAFEYAIENYGLDWGDTLTTEQASELRKAVVVPRFPTALKAPKVDVVKGWFDRWYLWYPFVDRVAVERAVDFDLKVWGELTARERYETVLALVKHPDPWGELDVERIPNDPVNGGAGVSYVATSPRIQRLYTVPWAERRHIGSAVRHEAKRLANG